MVCQKEERVYAVCSQFKLVALGRFMKMIMVSMIHTVSMILLWFFCYICSSASLYFSLLQGSTTFETEIHRSPYFHTAMHRRATRRLCDIDIILLPTLFPFAVQLDFVNYSKCSCLSNKMKYINQNWFLIYKGQVPE